MKTKLLLAIAYAKNQARFEYWFGKHSSYTFLFLRFFIEGIYQVNQPYTKAQA